MADASDIERVTAPPRRGGWAWPALALFAVSLVLFGVHLADELIEGEGFSFDTRLLLALRVPGHPQTPIGPAWLLQSAVDIRTVEALTCPAAGMSGAMPIWRKRRPKIPANE